MSILTDALELLCNQGELFIAAGMVFLDPGFATEMLAACTTVGRRAGGQSGQQVALRWLAQPVVPEA